MSASMSAVVMTVHHFAVLVSCAHDRLGCYQPMQLRLWHSSSPVTPALHINRIKCAQTLGACEKPNQLCRLHITLMSCGFVQALLRRLEKRIHVDLPSQEARKRMFTSMLSDRGVGQHQLTYLSQSTSGHSGSDIASLCKDIAIRLAPASVPKVIRLCGLPKVGPAQHFLHSNYTCAVSADQTVNNERRMWVVQPLLDQQLRLAAHQA